MPNYLGEAILDPETRGRGRDLHLTSNVNWNLTEGSEPIPQFAPGIGYQALPLYEDATCPETYVAESDRNAEFEAHPQLEIRAF
jgi:hypothetical protein